jgi:hypothetical protein
MQNGPMVLELLLLEQTERSYGFGTVTFEQTEWSYGFGTVTFEQTDQRKLTYLIKHQLSLKLYNGAQEVTMARKHHIQIFVKSVQLFQPPNNPSGYGLVYQ